MMFSWVYDYVHGVLALPLFAWKSSVYISFFSNYKILLPGCLSQDDLPVLLEVNSVPMIGPDSLVNRQVTKDFGMQRFLHSSAKHFSNFTSNYNLVQIFSIFCLVQCSSSCLCGEEGEGEWSAGQCTSRCAQWESWSHWSRLRPSEALTAIRQPNW